MTLPKGRAKSPFSTPLLLRAYLEGTDGFPEDTQEQKDARLRQGDFPAHIHQFVKQKIKAIEQETHRRYQYPRQHSFNRMITHLITLGLLERTGHTEPAQGRGQGLPADAIRQLSPRTWVRLTMGSPTRPEWADYMGYIALRYPGIRPAGKQPSAAPRAVEAAAPTPRRRRQPARTTAGPSAEVVAQLEGERKRVVTLVMAVADRGSTVAHFQRGYDEMTSFMGLLAQHYPRTPFPRAADDLPLVKNCIDLLKQEPMTRPLRATRVNNCQASTRTVGIHLQSPLEATAEAERLRAPPQVGEELEVPAEPRAPRQRRTPAAPRPRRVTTEAVVAEALPAIQVEGQRQTLWARAGQLAIRGGTLADFQQLFDDGEKLVDLMRQRYPASVVTKVTGPLDNLQIRIDIAKAPGISRGDLAIRMADVRAAAQRLAQALAEPFPPPRTS